MKKDTIAWVFSCEFKRLINVVKNFFNDGTKKAVMVLKKFSNDATKKVPSWWKRFLWVI